MEVIWVQYLVGELRSHMPRDVAKKISIYLIKTPKWSKYSDEINFNFILLSVYKILSFQHIFSYKSIETFYIPFCGYNIKSSKTSAHFIYLWPLHTPWGMIFPQPAIEPGDTAVKES